MLRVLRTLALLGAAIAAAADTVDSAVRCPHAPTPAGRTLLHHAAATHNLNLLQLLLARQPTAAAAAAAVLQPDLHGRTALHLAAADRARAAAVGTAAAAASAAAAADVAAVAVMGPTRTGSDIQTARIA